MHDARVPSVLATGECLPQELVHLRRRRPAGRLEDLGVATGSVNGGVPHQLLKLVEVDAARAQQRCPGMAQLIKHDLGQPCAFENVLQNAVGFRLVDCRPASVREYEPRLRPPTGCHSLKLAQAMSEQKRIEGLLATVGLPHRVASMYPHELSGGMKQRVCVALAISLQPKVIIGDGPTSALDVVVPRQVVETIKGLQQSMGTRTWSLSSHISKGVVCWCRRR